MVAMVAPNVINSLNIAIAERLDPSGCTKTVCATNSFEMRVVW